MTSSPPESQLEAIAALADPVRRKLYLLVSSKDGDTTREGAARALGISRAAATFHLERLVADGLLDASYRRVSGRRGPGAGRPARVYRGPTKELRVQIPGRDYELLARLLLEGLGELDTPDGSHDAARRLGSALGAQARRQAGSRPSRERLVASLTEVLRDRGFEPRSGGDGEVRLGNCPFHALARDHRDAVCSLNLSIMQGVLAGLRSPRIEAVLDPQPGMCCVAFRANSGSRA